MSSFRRVLRRTGRAAGLATAVTTVVVTGAALVPAAATAAPAARHVLPDTRPSWAAHDTDRGPTAADAPVTVRVYLASRDTAGLRAYATAVSDPHSAGYRHYLTPAAAASRFGPDPRAAGRVADWLRGSGLTATPDTTGRFLTAHGTAAAARQAFGTDLRDVTHDGMTVRAPAGNASVPAAVAADVLTVTGLSTAPRPVRPTRLVDATPAAAPTVPCSSYFGQKAATAYPPAYGRTAPYAVCGYTPKQFRGAYGVTGSGLTGAGETVAVVDSYATTTLAADVNRWAANRGEKPFSAGQLTQDVPAGTGYDPGWGGEEALDVESVHAMAPDAHVTYVAAKDDKVVDTTLDALNRIVDHRLADIVTDSWIWDTETGMDASAVTAFQQTFQQGAVEGIGFYFSSGDGGGLSSTTHQPYVFYPTADPWVTAVGGSSIAIDAANHYRWEAGWETDYANLAADGTDWTPAPPGPFSSGAGGGTSVVFDQPFYQRHVVPTALSEAHGATSPHRTVPDVAADGDPTTGFLEGDSEPDATGKLVYSEYRIGGTSLSSPLMAGIQALAEQAQHHVSIGFANPAIYDRYGSVDYHDVTDTPQGAGITETSVRTRTVTNPDGTSSTVVSLASLSQSQDAGLVTQPGYDTTTGVGTPNRAYLDSFRH